MPLFTGTIKDNRGVTDEPVLEVTNESGTTLLRLTVTRGHDDNAVLVFLDTGDETGLLRVTVNDGPIWNGDPSKHEHEFCECVGPWLPPFLEGTRNVIPKAAR